MSSSASPKQAGYLEAAVELKKNKRQLQAYESKGNCVVLAGPGSGKTKVLTTKLARMQAEDVRPPRGIACLTYSAECARELARRLSRLGVRSSRNLFIGTVHSFCFKSIILPYAHLTDMTIGRPVKVATQAEKDRAFAEAVEREMGTDQNPAYVRVRCEAYRRTILDREAPEWRASDADAAKVMERYEELLHAAGSIDFDDMVLMGLQLVEKHSWIRKAIRARYPIIAIDEYQDLGVPLHRLVQSLCFHPDEVNSRLFAVGDPDQSIYGFAGAKPELLKQLSERDDVETAKLELNYRSRTEIVRGGEAALGETRNYKSATGEGGIIDVHKCPNGLTEQAEKICKELIPAVLKSGAARSLGEIAVLYSNKDIGDVMANAATEAGLSFIRVDQNAAYPKTPLTRWLEDCAAWCAGGWEEGEPPLSELISRFINLSSNRKSPAEELAARRKLVRFLFDNRDGDTLLATWLDDFEAATLADTLNDDELQDEAEVFKRLKASAAKGGTLGKWNVSIFGGQGGSPGNLNLLTLHSSKGLEFDVVFMLGMDEGIEPPWFAKAEEVINERRRLFFVGFTRARNEVHMMYSGWTLTKNGHRKNNGPSRFLIELSQRLKEAREAK